MSFRSTLLDAIKEVGWANCFELCQQIGDPDFTVATTAPELRAMDREGILQHRIAPISGRTEYGLAYDVRVRSAPIVHAVSPMIEGGSPVAEAAAPNRMVSPVNGSARPPEATKYGSVAAGIRDVLARLGKATTRKIFEELGRADLTVKDISAQMSALVKCGHATNATNRNGKLEFWLVGASAKLQPKTAKTAAPEPQLPAPAGEADAPSSGDSPIFDPLLVEEVPAIPTARVAADELSPIEDLAPTRPKERDPIGLLARAEVIATDLEDLLGDACDKCMDHELIKMISVANGAMQRVARRMAAQ